MLREVAISQSLTGAEKSGSATSVARSTQETLVYNLPSSGWLERASRLLRSGRGRLMAYLPNTQQEQAEMLLDLGLSRLDDLFRQVPDHLTLQKPDLPEPLSEIELDQYFRELGQLNELIPPALNFLGGGASRRSGLN